MPHERSRFAVRITADPEILGGKPAIKGTRIPVALVLDHLANNPSFDELFADYPELTIADVQACLAYGQALADGKRVKPAPRRRLQRALRHAV